MQSLLKLNNAVKITGIIVCAMIIVGCGGPSTDSDPEPDPKPEPAESDTVEVQDVSELTIALNNVEPGEVILVDDGIYEDASISISKKATKENPIMMKAKNRGEVIFSGDFNWSVSGNYIHISGIHFTNGTRSSDSDLIVDKGNNNEYAFLKFDNLNDVDGVFLKLEGRYTSVHHSTFDGKETEQSFINIDVPQQGGSKMHIYKNYFSRGGEIAGNKSAIRVGYGGVAFQNGYNLIEKNLFDNCDSESEVVSVKTSRNYIRYNTFLNSVGSLSLRHGKGSIVEGNYFIHNENDESTGKRKDKTGGIVVRSSGHYIFNNYFYDLDFNYRINEDESGAIAFGAGSDEHMHGDSSAPLLFAVAKDVVVAYNTVISNRSRYSVDFLLGYGTRGRTQTPEHIRFYNNVFDDSQEFMHTRADVDAEFRSNFYAGSDLNIAGIEPFDLKTKQQFDIPVPTSNNAFKDQSVEIPFDQPDYGEFAARDIAIGKDILGRSRDAQKDAGAFEMVAGGTIENPPLRKEDVGCGF